MPLRSVSGWSSTTKQITLPIGAIARKIGCTPETSRSWARQAECDADHREGTDTTERERIKALESENRELMQTNEILRKASAYFAQAELDLRGK